MWLWWWVALYTTPGLLIAALAKGAKQLAMTPTQKTPSSWPSVTVIKPVRGINEFTEEAFISWLQQTYRGELDFIFSFQDPSDPSISLLQKLNPSAKTKILVNDILEGFSGKASNLYFGVEAASSEFLIFSDADIIASPFVVQEIVARTEKCKSIVSCLPVHTHAFGPWAHLYASVWNSTLIGLWAPAMLKNKAPGVAGGTVGFYRSDLQSIGGVSSFANYVAEDLKMGALFKEKGFQFHLGPVVESKVGHLSFRQYWNALMRGSFVSWNTENGGIIKSLALHTFAYGYAPVLIYGLIRNYSLVPPTVAILVFRMLLLTWFRYLADAKIRIPLFTFFNDLMTLMVLAVSICTRRLVWANVSYRITRDGRMIRSLPLR